MSQVSGAKEELRSEQRPVLWVLRRARQRDWHQILAIQSAANRPERQDSKCEEYIVGTVGKEIVGCVAGRCVGKDGYLHGLVVAKQWRRQGIGHALTSACVDSLGESGTTRIFLTAMFWNVRFFEKHGFSLTKRSLYPEIEHLHGDFREEWGRRSAILFLDVQPHTQLKKHK